MEPDNSSPEGEHPDFVAFATEVSGAMRPVSRHNVGPEVAPVAKPGVIPDFTTLARQRVEAAIDAAPPRTRDQL